DLVYFERMCAAGAVDCLQVDASRCAGITEWLRACAVAAAHGLDVSAHTAPSLHAHPACAVPNLRHIEHFVDHARAGRPLLDRVGLNAAAKEVEAEGGTAPVVAADVARTDQVVGAADTIEDALGPIDVWVNAAMATVFAPFTEVSADEFRRVTETTYLGTVYG